MPGRFHTSMRVWKPPGRGLSSLAVGPQGPAPYEAARDERRWRLCEPCQGQALSVSRFLTISLHFSPPPFPLSTDKDRAASEYRRAVRGSVSVAGVAAAMRPRRAGFGALCLWPACVLELSSGPFAPFCLSLAGPGCCFSCYGSWGEDVSSPWVVRGELSVGSGASGLASHTKPPVG